MASHDSLNNVIDQLNEYGCTRETLRARIRRAYATGWYSAAEIADLFGIPARMAQRAVYEMPKAARSALAVNRKYHRRTA